MKQTVILVIALQLLVGCSSLHDKSTSQVRSQAETAQEPAFSELVAPDKLREDLDFLFKTIAEVHPNMYAYISEEEFAKHRAALYEQINKPMSRLGFYRLLAPTVAQLRNGHTQVHPFLAEFQEHLKNGGAIFPISLSFDGERVVLTRNLGSNELPVGGALLEINGKDAIQEMSRYASYFAAEYRDTNPMVFQEDVLLWCLLWLDYGDSESLQLRIRSTQGATLTHTLKPIPYDDAKSKAAGTTSREPDPFTYRSFPKEKTGLITVSDFTDHARFQTFLQKTFGTLKTEGVENLIIDVRGNPGGIRKLSTSLLRYLTEKPIREFDEMGVKFSSQYCNAHPGILEGFQEFFPQKDIKVGSYLKVRGKDLPAPPTEENPLRFKGRIYVLIDSGAASASVMLAATIKGMGIGTTVGTETMDTMSFYAESFLVTLPNTGLQAAISCMYVLCVGGTADGRGVLPDYEVKQKPEDTATDVDTVLQFTLDLVKNGKNRDADQRMQGTDSR